MGKNPRVSILCVTYNHERFIRQALESFVAQKTNFDFEVLINDDASTDRTTDIIREFKKKYPKIIKPIFHKENQYSKGVRNMVMKFLLPIVRGEYIAPCEGDDFFIDENKLQIQVDFLDKNPDYSMCFHQTRWFFENNEEPDSIFPDIAKGTDFSIEKLLKENFMNTNAPMYRKQDYKNFPKKNIMPGDWFLHLYHAKFGKIGFINKVMSAYRRHSSGIWWSSYKNPDEIIENHGGAHLGMYFELLKLYSENKIYKGIIFENIDGLLKQFIKIDREKGSKLFERALMEYPSETVAFLSCNFYSEPVGWNENVNQDVSLLVREIEIKNKEIQFIKSSKFWKLRDKYLKFKKIWNLQGRG